MNHTTALHIHLARRVRHSLVAMVIALVAVMGLPASGASAYSSSVAGLPGAVTPYTVYGQMVAKSSNGYYSTIPGVWVPGPLVTRSASFTGRQYIKYNLHIEQYLPSTNSWVTRVVDNVYVATAYLEAGQSYVKFSDRYEQLGSGTYRVSYVIRWFNSTGVNIALKLIHFNHYGDYQCRAGLYCQTGAGWVRI